MSGSEKPCVRCGVAIGRRPKMSDGQWKLRRFCSRKCAATKCLISDAELRRLYDGGMSGSEISRIAGISGKAVLSNLRRSGVSVRSLRDAMKLSHNKPGMSDKFSKAATGRKHSERTKEKMRAVMGANHPLWRSGLTITSGGYLQFTRSKANGDHAGRLLHQVVCEWKEGRGLIDGYHVHHIDGNKLNNHPDNLTSMSASDHAKIHNLGAAKDA